MSLFDKKKEISRRDLKEHFKKDSGYIRGGEGKYNMAEREKMAKELFGHEYGSQISRLDYKRRLRKLEEERSKALGMKQREKVDDKIKYLRQLGRRDV